MSRSFKSCSRAMEIARLVFFFQQFTEEFSVNATTMEKCRIGLHESLATSAHCAGRKTAMVHVACVTKRGEVLLVLEGMAWGFPKRVIPLVGALILLPDELIKKELGRDPKYLRGTNPSCADTKLLGQYVDDDGLLHFVLQVNISHTPCQQWKYVSKLAELERVGVVDEAVTLAAARLGLSSAPEKVLQAA